jgi:puromycin-sensitive aminopeptidase
LDAEWIYANADQAGFYRVSYPEAWTKKILSNVNKLSAVERMGLQNDWFALGFANMIDIHHAVSLAQSYKSETSYAVWSDLHENLRTLADLWVDQPTYPVLESMFEEIFSSVLDRLGFTHKDDDTDVQKLLRVLIIDQAGYYKNPQVLNWAKEAFASHISGVSSIAPDFRKTVYKLVCLNQGEEAFKQLKTLFFQAETTEEQNRLLVGLGYSRNESLIREVLELSLSPSVRVQDGFFVFISTSLSQVGRQTAWEYFKEHWEEYVERYATNSFIFVKMIELVTKSFHSYEAAADVEEFFSTRATPAINLKISQSLEQIRSKASWYSAQSSKFAEYLENQN